MPETSVKQAFKNAKTLPGDNLREHCTAKCRRYYAFPITKPKKWARLRSSAGN